MEAIFPLFSLPHSAAASSATGSTLRNGLVGHWTFDGADFVSNLRDVSGNNNTGYLANIATSSAKTNGKRGQALIFDNTDDYVRVPHSTSLDLTSELTFATWIKKSSLASDDDVLIKGPLGDPFTAQYGIETSGDEVAFFYVNLGGSGVNFQRTVDANLVTDRWYHVTVTYSDSANAIQFFVDGVLQSEETVSGNPENDSLVNNTDPVYLGEYIDGEPLDGALDDVRIYNRVLTASEVKQLANLGTGLAKPPNALGLVGYWSFNEGTGTQATDFSGNRNTGTLTNMETADWVSGKRGGGLNFDGDAATEYVNVGAGINVSGAVTVCAWAKADVFTADGSEDVIVAKSNATGLQIQFSLGSADELSSTQKSVHFFWSDDGGATEDYRTVATIVTGTWYHLCGVRTAGGVGSVYINGASATVNTPTSVSITTNATASTGIGRPGDLTGTFYWDGLIDEVRIYNRELTASEIAALYGSGAVRVVGSTKSLQAGSTLQSGLVGLWTFDGADFTTTVTDASGNGNTGSLFGGTRFNMKTNGKFGQALLLDGAPVGNEDGQYLSVNDAASLDITGDITLAAWVKRDVVGGVDGIITKNDNVTWSYDLYVNSSNQLGFDINGSNVANSSNTVADTEWHHVAATRSGSTIVFYIDGTAAGVGLNGTAFNSGSMPVSVGTFSVESPCGSGCFDGAIDDARIYNRALSTTEVKRLYNLGRTTIAP